jgi:hypothetical protein
MTGNRLHDSGLVTEYGIGKVMLGIIDANLRNLPLQCAVLFIKTLGIVLIRCILRTPLQPPIGISHYSTPLLG